MGTLKKYTPFFASVVLMWIVLYIIYPHYQYYIDPDGTAYLTISKRYATGDYARAINGYWSPWSCWLTAILIKVGLQPVPASVIINSLGAAGFLYISQSFFLRFGLQRMMQWLLNITLSIFLIYAVFWQSFDDLWECFFLLGTLRLMLVERFLQRSSLWIACGIIGALAYFAKAYSFPFFILNTICCTYLLARTQQGKWVKPAAISIATMIVCGLPWIWVLHGKYGLWTTSTSGSLNMSWYLVGHPEWKQGITALLPPPYHDSPYYWEDPWFVNGATPHFWDSWQLFGLQILRVGYNCWKLLRSMAELSIIFPLIAFVAVRILRRKETPIELKVVSLSFLLFPLGYLLINYEGRYLWYMVPLSIVISCIVISHNIIKLSVPVKRLGVVLALSFLVIPLWRLFHLYDKGMNEFELAQIVKQIRLKGSFTSNARQSSMSKIAYFSGIQYYPPVRETSVEDLVTSMRANGIRYCFVYLNKWDRTYFDLSTVPGGLVKTIDFGKPHNLIIYQMW